MLESNLKIFSGRGGTCPQSPRDTRRTHLLYHENPPTSKLNKTPEKDGAMLLVGTR